MNEEAICLTTTLRVIRVVVGGWNKGLVLSIQTRVLQDNDESLSPWHRDSYYEVVTLICYSTS